MKSFKEFLAESKPSYEWLTFSVEEYLVHVLFESSTGSLITEAKHKGMPLVVQFKI